MGDAVYREWIEEPDYGKVSNASSRVARAMQTVGGRSYRARYKPLVCILRPERATTMRTVATEPTRS